MYVRFPPPKACSTCKREKERHAEEFDHEKNNWNYETSAEEYPEYHFPDFNFQNYEFLYSGNQYLPPWRGFSSPNYHVPFDQYNFGRIHPEPRQRSHSTCSKPCGIGSYLKPNTHERIIGGYDSLPNGMPWMVRIYGGCARK